MSDPTYEAKVQALRDAHPDSPINPRWAATHSDTRWAMLAQCLRYTQDVPFERIGYVMADTPDYRIEPTMWCYENTVGKWNTFGDYGKVTFSFDEERDELLFKLTWADEIIETTPIATNSDDPRFWDQDEEWQERAREILGVKK